MANPSILEREPETVAQGVQQTWEEAKNTISDGVETVKEKVANSVEAVKSTVQDTTRAVGRALDFSEHVRRNPWLFVGGAVLVGMLIGSALDRMRN